MHVPLLQTLPAAHFTPAQRFSTHCPPLQIWLVAHLIPAQGFGDAQVRLQACPVPHEASQALSTTHAPLPGLQYFPDGQVTPLHGSRKHPAMQAPPTQVCPSEHATPAHGSVTATHVAWQLVPVTQFDEGDARHGSS